MADQREVALHYIKTNGPVIPIQVSKVLNTNILFASAVLSELVEKKQLKMTSAAIGGSKVYYIKGQEPLLGEKLYNFLNPVEKEVFDLLKEKKVLRDVELEPKERIALRDLKDFAMPLTITAGNQSEIFWKFHIVSDEEVKGLLQSYIEEAPEPKKSEIVELSKSQEVPNINDVVAKLKEELIKEMNSKLVQKEDVKKDIAEEKKALQEDVEGGYNDERKIVEKGTIEGKKSVEVAVKKPKKKERIAKEDIPIEEIEAKEISEEEIKEKFVDKTDVHKANGRFYNEILDFFNDSGIKIVKEEMVKKEKEYDFIVKVSSAFGAVSYFVKARDKKAFNDSDVSLAYSAGQLKGLPTILLGKGKLNKKAVSLIDEKLSGKFVFKELE